MFALLIDNDGAYWMHLLFITYPPLTNFFLLLIQKKNFKAKVQESKAFTISLSDSNIQNGYDFMPSFLQNIQFLFLKDILKHNMTSVHE